MTAACAARLVPPGDARRAGRSARPRAGRAAAVTAADDTGGPGTSPAVAAQVRFSIAGDHLDRPPGLQAASATPEPGPIAGPAEGRRRLPGGNQGCLGAATRAGTGVAVPAEPAHQRNTLPGAVERTRPPASGARPDRLAEAFAASRNLSGLDANVALDRSEPAAESAWTAGRNIARGCHGRFLVGPRPALTGVKVSGSAGRGGLAAGTGRRCLSSPATAVNGCWLPST